MECEEQRDEIGGKCEVERGDNGEDTLKEEEVLTTFFCLCFIVTVEIQTRNFGEGETEKGK